MIMEDYVSFETTKLLKEKRFDIPCNAYFVEVEKETAKNKFKRRFCHSSVEANRNAYKSEMANHYYFSCPTLQMVVKWLRKVHNFHIWVEPNHDKEGLYDVHVKVGWWSYNWAGIGYNTPEEACEAAIKYCLENLI